MKTYILGIKFPETDTPANHSRNGMDYTVPAMCRWDINYRFNWYHNGEKHIWQDTLIFGPHKETARVILQAAPETDCIYIKVTEDYVPYQKTSSYEPIVEPKATEAVPLRLWERVWRLVR